MSKKVYNYEISEEIANSKDYIQDLVYVKKYDSFYLWSGNFTDREEGHFVKLDEKEMRKEIYKHCKTRHPNQNYTVPMLEDIKQLLKMDIHKVIEDEDTKYVAFKDVLLNVETFKTEPFCKSKMCTLYFPYTLEETKQKTPVFDKFLATSLVYEKNVYKTDEQLVELAKEMMGSFLSNNLQASKAYFLYGPTASNGKSQLGLLLKKIFGDRYTSHLSLADLSARFGPVSLIGKRVNIAGELDEKFGNSKMFKSLVSGDYVKAEYKFKDNISFRPIAKYIFMTNKIPTFDGLDRGVRRRLMILPFYRTFDPKDPDYNYNLEKELAKEVPGIIGIMVKYAEKLQKSKYQFSKANALKKTLKKFDNEMSSASMFLEDENWEISDDKDMYIPRTNLYEIYRQWSIDVGKKPLSRNRFYDDLTNLIDKLNTVQLYKDGRPQYCFNLVKEIPDDIPADEGTEIVDKDNVYINGNKLEL